MTTAHIDIETYCDLSLKDVGVYKYASHPSFKILLLAYAIDDGPTGYLIWRMAMSYRKSWKT